MTPVSIIVAVLVLCALSFVPVPVAYAVGVWTREMLVNYWGDIVAFAAGVGAGTCFSAYRLRG